MARQVVGGAVLAGVTVACWWVWLGRDTEYVTDPVTQSTSGPYEPAQVIGCALSVAALAVVGGLVLRPWVAVLAITGAFTVAWSVAAAGSDESGLWLVGAVLVLVAASAGTAVCAFGARWIRTAVRTRRRPGAAAR